jgi:hypothetical protein
VLALGGHGTTAIEVVAVIAHPLGIMLGVGVRAARDLALFTPSIVRVLRICLSSSAPGGPRPFYGLGHGLIIELLVLLQLVRSVT